MKLRDTLDKISQESADTRVDIVEIRKDLNYHIKRTDIVEERLAAHLKVVEPIIGFFKILALILVSGAALAAILRLFI
jgi:hypothetical protein